MAKVKITPTSSRQSDIQTQLATVLDYYGGVDQATAALAELDHSRRQAGHPSGSGKSTLLNLIGGLDKPDSGAVTVDGHNLAKLSDGRLSEFRNRTIGFVFQFFYLQPFLNLRTNLAVPGMFSHLPKGERDVRITELAAAVGIADRLEHLPKELSGGQMQRAAIARALLNRPKIILADEPTGNVDRANAHAIMELFAKVRDTYHTTIIIVTHDTEAARFADRAVTIRDGRLS
jgi:ABC-type lipoprotein export system ATPase subunit